MASQWGRKETVIWPPQVPIYTIGTVIFAVPILLMLLFGLYITKPFLARNYTGDYLKSAAGAEFKMHNCFRLIYLFGGKRAPRVAEPDDFVPGTTILPNRKVISVQLSPAATAQGFTSFARGPERKIADEALYGWFKAAIFGGDDLRSAYGPALIEAGVIIVFLLCFAVPWDFKRGKRMKYGRLLRGPVMSAPKEFNQILKGEGLGIRTDEKGTIIRLPLRAEAKHVQVMGDTGVGKTTLLIQMLTQIEDRGESAIVYDPAGEYPAFLQGRPQRCDPESARRPVLLLVAVERAAEPGRGPNHRIVALPASRRKTGRVLYRNSSEDLRAPDEVPSFEPRFSGVDVQPG